MEGDIQQAKKIFEQHKAFLATIAEDLPTTYIKKSCQIAIDLKISGLPSINDTPPVRRLENHYYAQFWIGVSREIDKIEE